MAELLTIRKATFRRGDAIRNVSIGTGDYALVLGRSGTGKSAFCVGIQGLIDGVEVGSNRKINFAYVPTDPTLVFTGIKGTVRGEIELTFQFQGRAIEGVSELAKAFKCEALLERDPFTLSGGEAMKVAICVMAALEPDVWILDQCYDWLFSESREEIRKNLLERSGGDAAIIETHSIAPDWYQAFNRRIVIDKESSRTGGFEGPHFADPFLMTPQYEKIGTPAGDRAHGVAVPALEVENLVFQYQAGGFQLGPVSLELAGSQIIAIVGPNGAGKTTFMLSLALLLLPNEGEVRVSGAVAHSALHMRPRQILYCFQNPDHQLYKASVQEEIDDVCSSLDVEKKPYWRELLENFELETSLRADPLSLGRPQRRLVTLASSLLAAPAILLFDEPTAGLDGFQRHQVAREIVRYAQGGGLALVVSHDEGFTNTIANQTIRFEDGKIRG